jgi:predicted nuclease with TOPRIM domain
MLSLNSVAVKELSEELSMLNGEKTALQDEIETLKQNYRQVKERFERITVESLEKMPIEEHLASIEECQKVTQDVERKCKAEAKNAFARLQAMQREKQSLEAEKAGSLTLTK